MDLKSLVVSYIKDPRHRRVVRRVLWMIAVAIVLVFSATTIWGGQVVTGSYRPGIAIAVALWAILVGGTASVVLPNKAVVAVFGGLAGVSLSEVSTAAGLISVMREQVVALAIELDAITNPGTDGTSPDPFISWMIWLFLGIVGLLCLPAFFEKDWDHSG